MNILFRFNPLGWDDDEAKLDVSQWGFQWNDPIDWNVLNYQTSANGRKFIRHPSNMGTVMSMNDGTDRNILVLDAQYRGQGYWGSGSYSRDHYCTNEGYVDGSSKILPFTGWTDLALNSSYSTKVNQDIHTSKENTDYMMSVNSDVQYYAGYCRSKVISHNGIEIGCDAPNINTVVRFYAEMIKLDEMDPTVSSYSGYSLSGWFSDARRPVCWSSSLFDSSYARSMRYTSYIDYGMFIVFNFGFAPILEL